MRRVFIGFMYTVCVLVLFASCSPDSETDSSRLTHTDIQLQLVDTTSETDYSDRATLTNAKILNTVPGNTVITEKAVVSSPQTSDGTVMQASDVSIGPNGKYAFVTYMLQGENNRGTLDIIDISNSSWPELSYSVDFLQTDLSAVAYNGSYIFVGGQSLQNTENGSYAYIRAIKFTGTKPDLSSDPVELHLPGYFTTDIAVNGNDVYVTTGTENTDGTLGAGVFLFSFDGTSFSETTRINLPDARSVAISSSDGIAVFEAACEQPFATAAIHFYDQDLSPTGILNVSANVLDESKTGIEFIGSYLMLAANTDGVLIVDPETRKIATTIPAPALPDIASNLQSSNDVSAGFANSKTIYFISNGEAGLWVGDTDSLTADSFGLSGSIRFSANISVNDVAAKNATVVAAAGIGGVRILELASPSQR